jgi:hypothetical protein
MQEARCCRWDARTPASSGRLSQADASPDACLASARGGDEAHEDDLLCLICLDAPRDTPLPCCAAAHAPVLCAPCAVRLCARERLACPLCRSPVSDNVP